MSTKPKVIITGAAGKMGSAAVSTFLSAENFELVGACVRTLDPQWTQGLETEIHNKGQSAVKIDTNLEKLIKETQADILVELTGPKSVFANAKTALENGLRVVIGATGLSEDNIKELEDLSKSKELGLIIAPNFAIGAILMMKFAKEAATHFDKYEIIEKHHDKKLDAPSGTAIKTAQLMSSVKKSQGLENRNETALGDSSHGVPIHSLRVPGLVANQEVIFGGLGQTLTISHETIDRSSFMPGIVLCCEKVQNLKGLVYGMENII